MLTPVDVQNKVFKGGIGFDKKDVEAFMQDLSSDYEQLYRSNVELKDKVATLTESLQHYRSTEESMQKALTLSEKTAEETIIAANDKARQINNEATKKAEALLADAKQELIETKNEIHRLQQLHAKFKAQYTKILEGQLQLIENKVVDIDLGEGYDIGNFQDAGFGGGSSLGGGLGSLGEGGGYTGASSFDDRFEHTGQGFLNTDPFADAANGGGRFSSKTGKGFTGGSSAKKTAGKNTGSSGDGKSSLNVKNADKGSTKVRKNFNPAGQEKPVSTPEQAPHKTEPAAKNTAAAAPKAAQPAQAAKNTATAKTTVPNTATAVPNPSTTATATARPVTPKSQPVAAGTPVSQAKPKTEIPVKSAPAPQPVKTDLHKENVIAGEVEDKIDESTLIGNDDDDSEGFNFMEETSDTVNN
ncbi:MAG: DivIVA domain-containing protein [Lachnospiraceae bacterium]|nr:DivIVA domain-containing protein [Lachnospiraceae bacterium]